MENTQRRAMVERELRDLPVGKVRVIAWEPTHRWSEDVYEIGTWGKKTSTFSETVSTLMRDPKPCAHSHLGTLDDPGKYQCMDCGQEITREVA